MKKITSLLVFIFSITLAAAQKKQPTIKPYATTEVKEAEKEADVLYKMLSFSSALKIFERLVVTEPNNAEYNYKLGICYNNTNIAKHKAVPYLEFAANSNEKSKPKDVLFELGKAYHNAGLYDKAIETYEAFRVQKGGTVDAKLKFNMYVDWSHNAKKLTETPVACTFTNLGKNINSNQADYRPVMGVADTIVYFTSKRKGTVGGMTDDLGESTSDIYFFTQNDTSRSKAKNAGVNINTEYYEETLFLNMNGDRLLVYREGPESNGDIYLADLQGKSWSKPVLLGKDFQTKALETGACLSPDGLTLYFAAETMDSKTGKDIYVCTRTTTTSWGKPEKLAGPVNTNFDEDNPVMWLDGKTLFFSSSGHNSMGGLDLFTAYMANPAEGFTDVKNVGYPVNSVYDDFNLALGCDGKTAYVAAVRDSGAGDYDIHKLVLEKPLVAQPLCWLQGKGITNVGTPAKGAFVVVTEAVSGKEMANLEANESNGRFDIALPAGNYKVVLKHAKAGKAEAEINIAADQSKAVVNLVFP